MIAFPLPLSGDFVGKGRWKLTAPFEYHSYKYGVIEIPIGFVTDGASIPRIARLIVGSPWEGKYAKASVPHDYLYDIQIVTRIVADRLFLEAMIVKGVPWWKRRLMYRAVRLGAWIPWNRHRRELEKKYAR